MDLLPFIDTWGNYTVKSQYFLSSTIYYIMPVFLGRIYSCFGVTYYVLEVMYALTLVDHVL